MARTAQGRWRGFRTGHDFQYAVSLIETVAWLAGRPDYLDDLAATVDRLKLLERSGRSKSANLYEWFVAMANYQGISDAVAESYIADHEKPRWRSIARGVKTGACSRLQSYWHFHGCGYQKIHQHCANADDFAGCPLPRHDFRNGNLNQLSYSLYLFIRDVAGGDLVGWIDQKLAEASESSDRASRVDKMAGAIGEPLSGVHSLSNKVIGMILSDLLIVGGRRNPHWGEAGGSFVAIDTLVHNFLVRTGILMRARANHPYGPQCYGDAGCATVLKAVCQVIDARQFNSAFPRFFPRYVQRAIWAYCAADEHAICNGRTIRDDARCKNRDCRIFDWCDRVSLAADSRKLRKML
jgi:hypothetical protein